MSLVGIGCEKKVEMPPPPVPQVEIAKPIVREITEWDEYTGRLAAVESVDVRPRVSGYLQSIHFKEGQIVNKGDLLFVIDPRPYRATLAVAEAEVARAQTRLDLARNDAQRAENLVKSRAISTEEADTRSKAAVEAQAVLEAARARVEQVRLDLEFTEIRSPVTGRISNFFVTVGNLVTASTTLLTTIVSLDPIHCYFDVDEQAYLRYSGLAVSGARPSSREQANPIRIALANDPQFSREGKMDFVDNRIDQLTGTLRGRGIIPNPDGTLIPGLFVRVRLVGETKPRAVLVPDVAIGTDLSNRVVYVVGADQKVSMRKVTTGRMVDGLRLVRQGLEGNESLIVSGVQRVQPGAQVNPLLVQIDDKGKIIRPAKETPAVGTSETDDHSKSQAQAHSNKEQGAAQ